MTPGAISVRGLGKRYRIWARRSDKVLDWLSGGRRATHRDAWAVRDVSFEVAPGEALGIIGMNGAGKSTLLRMLAGTTVPSTGTFEAGGRIAALLELGLGMHPEFDGWQNASLSCQLMGLDRATIRRALPEIREFSELGEHMDRPVRTYSTGMQVRLAFAVATCVRPDLLVVDEALSVGDAYFQHKSVARIREFREQGTTLLFVTHDPGAVKALCDRAILLDGGRVLRDGRPDAVFDYYNALIARKEAGALIEQAEDSAGTRTRSGSGEARIVSVDVLDADGESRRAFRTGETARIHCTFQTLRDMPRPTLGVLLRDRLGNDVFGTNTFALGVPVVPCDAGEKNWAEFRLSLLLGIGTYSVSVALHTAATHVESNFDWWDRAIVLQVVRGDGPEFTGVAALPVEVAASANRPAPSPRADRDR